MIFGFFRVLNFLMGFFFSHLVFFAVGCFLKFGFFAVGCYLDAFGCFWFFFWVFGFFGEGKRRETRYYWSAKGGKKKQQK